MVDSDNRTDCYYWDSYLDYIAVAVPVADKIPWVVAHTTVVVVVVMAVVVVVKEVAVAVSFVPVLSKPQFALVIVLISGHALVVPCTVILVRSVIPIASPPHDDHFLVDAVEQK